MDKKKILILITAAIVVIAAIAVAAFLAREVKTEVYTVTFRDFDGTVLKTQSVEAGESATAPADPRRDGYTFAGWDKAYSSVVKDTVVTAEYIRLTETTFTVDTITVTQDTKQAEVKVSVANNPGILGMMFSVNYDEATLKLVDCQNGVALSALSFQEPSKLKSDCNFVWYGSEAGEVTDGEMLILTFEIAESANSGTYPVTIQWDDRDIMDSNCDLLNPDVVQGGIIIPD